MAQQGTPAASPPLRFGVRANKVDFRGGTKIDLQDSALESIEVSLEQRICKCKIRLVSQEPNTVVLRFSGVIEVRIPHADPWGPSSSVLEVNETENSCVLAMQSGDTISIMATAYEVEQI